MEKVNSDGGSSSYYEIVIPKDRVKELDEGFQFEVKDVIRHALNNDYDKGNVFKAMVRSGKKAGADITYDLVKNVFFTVDALIAEVGREETGKILTKVAKDLTWSS